MRSSFSRNRRPPERPSPRGAGLRIVTENRHGAQCAVREGSNSQYDSMLISTALARCAGAPRWRIGTGPEWGLLARLPRRGFTTGSVSDSTLTSLLDSLAWNGFPTSVAARTRSTEWSTSGWPRSRRSSRSARPSWSTRSSSRMVMGDRIARPCSEMPKIPTHSQIRPRTDRRRSGPIPPGRDFVLRLSRRATGSKPGQWPK